MTTSEPRALCTLKFRTQGHAYEANLQTLVEQIEKTPAEAIVLAPEVCLTGFDYEAFGAAADFCVTADARLRACSRGRSVILTMVERRPEGYCNVAKVYHDGDVVYEQCKTKLFTLGEEERWFRAGDDEAITIVELDGIRLGILICFELRFTALWERLRGAELIAVPAQWGRLRASHFDILGRALAVANQCYVMQSDTDNDDTSGLGGIITPFGECTRNEDQRMLCMPFDRMEVQKMRRYLDTGLRA